MTIRRVRTNGEVKWKGKTIYLSEALKGGPVGLKPGDDRHWTIPFDPLIIGLLDDHAKRVVHTPTKVLPMCPVALRSPPTKAEERSAQGRFGSGRGAEGPPDFAQTGPPAVEEKEGTEYA